MSRAVTIDIGNTWTKVCVFEGDILLHSTRIRHPESAVLRHIASVWHPEHAALCSVRRSYATMSSEIEEALGCPLLEVSASTPLPIGIDYAPPASLGADRIAAACGASAIYPGADILVIDAGTAITTDVVAGGCFRGGRISPGIRLRLHALSAGTGMLPRIEPDPDTIPAPFGHDTASCIAAGTLGGILAEMRDAMQHAAERYGCTRAVISGGHSRMLASALGHRTPMPLTAVPEIVSFGLKRIIDYNEDQN